ncbi:solute carrier family 35 member F1 [Trichosurus vulpecula]|uniref:solute carrier family 35 member F1 n=1 Tax=Trichosurus vulpecula TaxID=9337 RepID=UPI00186B5274|nr:solute carrier family 35 member F1 [Trichosurus vulpecula]
MSSSNSSRARLALHHLELEQAQNVELATEKQQPCGRADIKHKSLIRQQKVSDLTDGKSKTSLTYGVCSRFGMGTPGLLTVNAVLHSKFPAENQSGGEENLLAILRRRWWKYMILGIIDLEANYLVVKAYQYTTLTSVQLLDCFVIPVVILLSWFFLLIRYKAVHFVGIVVCILGMGCMAGADVLMGRQQGAGENKLIGDLLVLGGATLYGISNVWEEYIIRTLSRVEFLGMIGLFGAFFSGIQLAIMEHKELLKVPWDWQIGLLYVGFSACMFGLYSFMPVVIKKTSATSVNLNLLTADLYSLFCGLFLFHYKFSGLYLLSFFTILVGLVLYSSTSTYIAQDPRVYKQFRNPSGTVVDLPASGQVEPSVTYTSLGQEMEEEPHVRVA